MTNTWNDIWDRRQAPGASETTLKRLMTGAGLDSGFTSYTEADYREYVDRIVAILKLQPGESVCEVGCGAGSFLYVLDELGFKVSGIDRASALVAAASDAVPAGDFAVADASELSESPRVDVILAQSVFQYFPSIDYAFQVLGAMAGKARRAVAVLDLPDIACKQAEITERQRLAGGAAAYAARYTGLEHRYFDRTEVAQHMQQLGLTDVRIQTQQMGGHDNAVFRFNAWGFHGEGSTQ